MWGEPTVTVVPTSEPVTLADARVQCRVETDEVEFDTELTHLIKAARAYVESHCGLQFASQTLEAQCDRFADMARLPFAPVQSVVLIAYVDADGAAQTVSSDDYTLVKDRFAPSIQINSDKAWPSIRVGSRIVLSVVVGGEVPEEAMHAMRLLIGHWFKNHEAVEIGNAPAALPMGVDALLANHRR